MIITIKFKSTKAFNNVTIYREYEYERDDIGNLMKGLFDSTDMNIYVYLGRNVNTDPIASYVRKPKGYIVESTNAWRYRHENHH